MQKIQHILSGLAIALVFIYAASPKVPDSVIIFLMLISGTIFPDIDTEFLHRALLHNIFLPLLLLLFVPLYHFLIFFIGGILLHLTLDVFSEGNIRLMFPLDVVIKNKIIDFLNLDLIRGVPNDSMLAWLVTGFVTGAVCGVILMWYGVV
jgi:membrane-bound metal-dependent hydrolase YbcI (DUF457 family)